jgi:hypothetical protein
VSRRAVEHVGERRVHRVDGAEPVDPRHLLRLLDARVAQRPVVGDPGVRDEHVDAAGLGDEARHGVLDLAAVADVGGERDRVPGQRLGVARGQPDRRAPAQQLLRDGAPDPA